MTEVFEAEGGLGMLDLGVDVEVGAYVTIAPLLIPSASCLPLGDQDTEQLSKIIITSQKDTDLMWE